MRRWPSIDGMLRRVLLLIIVMVVFCVAPPHLAHAQLLNQVPNGNWWRNCASLDMDFVKDRYYINSNSTCDGTTGTIYAATSNTGVQNFITGTGATFSRSGTTTFTTLTPTYLTGSQSFLGRSAATNNITSTFAPFYAIGGQTFVSRSTVGTYFDNTGTLQSAAANTARNATYTYSGGSFVANTGTLIEAAATNKIRDNSMTSATASNSTQLVTNGTFATSCSGSTCTGWTKTTGGTAAVTFATGSATLKGDGTNAARIYQKVTTVAGYTYILSVTTGAGNAVSVQVGSNNSGANLLAASTGSASTTTNYQFTAAGTNSYVQIGNTSTTAAVVTTVSVVSAGMLPTNWSITNVPAGVTYSVVGTGVENGITYIDISFSGTNMSGATATPTLYFETTTGIAATLALPWTESFYIRAASGSLPSGSSGNVTLLSTSYASGPTVINNYTSNVSLASVSSINAQRVSATTTLPDLTTAFIDPGFQFTMNSTDTVSLTLRIGMPQMEQSSFPTSVIATTTAAVTRSADVYNEENASYFDSSGNLDYAIANTLRDNHNYLSPYTDLGSLAEPAATNSIRDNLMVAASVNTLGIERLIGSTFSGCSGTTCNGWTTNVNSGTGTVAYTSGNATLTGDGTNAASIYQNITTIIGGTYNFVVTNGSGNAITVQLGTSSGGATVLAATSIAANTTTTFQILAISTQTYIQVNNVSTTAANVTAVSVQGAGKLPTDWSLSNIPTGVTYSISTVGTSNNINYVDIKFSGTNNSGSSASPSINFETTTGIGSTTSMIWSLSSFLAATTGTAPTIYLGWYELSSGTVLQTDEDSGHSLTSTLTRYNYSFTPTNTSISLQPGLLFTIASGATVNFTLRIGMPQMEVINYYTSSYMTQPIPTAGSAQTRAVDLYTMPTLAYYYNSTGNLTSAAANVPRLDYGPRSSGTSTYPLGLLIEGPTTNLIYYSENSASGYTFYNSTATPYATAAPDGTLTAVKVVETTAYNTHTLSPAFSITANAPYTFSIYFKSYSSTRAIYMFFYDGNDGNFGYFITYNPATQSFIGGNPTCYSVCTGAKYTLQTLPNGWSRLSMTAVPTTTSVFAEIYLFNITSGTTYTGDGASGVYFWGAQAEAGSFPTSYIPTFGSQVTRPADVLTLPTTAGGGSGWYNASGAQGVLGAVGEVPGLQTTTTTPQRIAALSDGTTSNIIGLGFDPSTVTERGYIYYNGSLTYGGSGPAETANTVAEGAIAFSSSSVNSAFGGTVGGASSGLTIPTVNTLYAGDDSGTSSYLNGWVNRIWYIPVRQSDSSLPSYTQ